MGFSIQRSYLGFILAACAATLWGSAGTAQSFISAQGLPPFWVAALRLAFASALFLPILTVTELRARHSDPPAFIPNDLRYVIQVLIAGTSMALFNLLFFTGVKEAGVALGSCTTIGSAPLWAGLLDYLIHKKKPSLSWTIGVSMAITGGIFMAVAQASSVEFHLWGLGVCVAAGFFYSLYSVCAQKLVRQTPPLKASSHVFLVAMVVALPVAWVMTGTPNFTLGDLLIVIYLGVIVTGLAYLLYTTALKFISVANAVALGLLEPVVAFLLAILVVNEPVTWGAALGLIFILAGLVFVTFGEKMLAGISRALQATHHSN